MMGKKKSKGKGKKQTKGKVKGSGGKVGKAIEKAKGFFGGGGGGGRRRKRSATWYAKEIVRMRLKKKYEKAKLGMYR